MGDEDIHEEDVNFSISMDMDDNRLDISVEKDVTVLTANVNFWFALYAQLEEIFEGLEDAKSDGTSP